ncbi:MAG TPA: hypothetical protein DC049_09340 [Spirochaetia bacterium]|nr:hypothetical protein [Spirochaetia bacterium]
MSASYLDDLDPAQREKIRIVNQNYEDKIFKLKKEIYTGRLELEALRLKDKPDEKAISGKLQEISENNYKLNEIYKEYEIEVKKVLPEPAASTYLSGTENHFFFDIGYCPMRR